MNDLQKLRTLKELINLRQKLTWSAQRRNETTNDFAYRMRETLAEYNSLGKLAQVEFTEVTQSSATREKLAIHTFLIGVKPKIKRYMCNADVYTSLHQVIEHARQIENNLIDIRRMRVVSFIETN